jgi:hypothetical protein
MIGDFPMLVKGYSINDQKEKLRGAIPGSGCWIKPPCESVPACLGASPASGLKNLVNLSVRLGARRESWVRRLSKTVRPSQEGH